MKGWFFPICYTLSHSLVEIIFSLQENKSIASELFLTFRTSPSSHRNRSSRERKRKRRTSFTPQALEKLNDAFESNTHPSGMDMSILAQQLNYDREVIRVW